MTIAGHRLRGRNPSEDDVPASQFKEREAPYTETMGRTVGMSRREKIHTKNNIYSPGLATRRVSHLKILR